MYPRQVFALSRGLLLVWSRIFLKLIEYVVPACIACALFSHKGKDCIADLFSAQQYSQISKVTSDP